MKTKVNPTELRDAWLAALQELTAQISTWVADEPGWTASASKTGLITEDTTGSYTAPLLTLHGPDGEVRVEPIARNFPGVGIVELYAWPTLRRVRLLPDKTLGAWRVLTDSGIFLHQDWNRMDFMRLVTDLTLAK